MLTAYPFLPQKLQPGWSYTSLSPMCVNRHVVEWHLPFTGTNVRRLSVKKKVKVFRYKPGVTLGVPGG